MTAPDRRTLFSESRGVDARKGWARSAGVKHAFVGHALACPNALPVLRPAGKLKCMNSLADLQEAITEGAVKRIRPKFMTVATMFLGLAPIMWSAGAGSDVTKRIAAPMIGGIFTSFLLELVVYPALYEVWRWHSVKRQVV